ncbi:T9SS type A sorting domain-containing protein [bacterium]|nr:T9SS type A sorting domain-containing protein [bacterium]
MKKILFIAAIILLLPVAVFAGTRNKVLGMLFTSTTCPPCVAANAALDQVLAERESTLAVVRFHMNWPSPGNDPWYHYDPAMNNFWRAMYAIDAVPTFVADGMTAGVSTSIVDMKAAEPTTLQISIYRQYPVSSLYESGNGKVKVELYNEDKNEATFKLYGALTESEVLYTGTNGDPEHDQAVFDMIPEYDGTLVTLKKYERKMFEFDFTTNHTINTTPDPHDVVAGNCELVFWCQEASGKLIYNAAKAKVVGADSAAPVMILSNIQVFDSNQNGSLEPSEEAEVKVTITNSSDSPIENAHVFLTIDDTKVDVIDGYAEIPLIAPGEAYVVEESKGDGLKLKTKSSYVKDTPFDMTAEAGSGEGYWSSYVQPLGINEETKPEFWTSVASVITTSNTAISLSLPASGAVELNLFDVSGARVKTLYSGSLNAGRHELPISLDNLSNGVYFVRIAAGENTSVSKVVVSR